jgi:hypothetical protein
MIIPILRSLFVILMLMGGLRVFAQERVALVIGNAKYEQLASLDNPKNDAEAVARKFSELGYKTALVIDGSDKKIKRELRAFSSLSEKAKVAVVYYAGHGAQVEGENYILPVDLDIPNTETDIKLSSIKVDDIIGAIKSKTKIVFLDACRDNPSLYKNFERGRGVVPRGLASLNSSYIAEEGGGIFIAFATDAGNVAEDGAKNTNSPFSAAFLKFASEPLSIDDVFSKITAEVKRNTNQKQRPFKYASMDGIICLNPACNQGFISKQEPILQGARHLDSMNHRLWLEKNWTYMGATESKNLFFYVDTSSIEVKGTKAKLRTLNFELDTKPQDDPDGFNIVEQVFDCNSRKSKIFEGATFDRNGNKQNGFISGDWLMAEPEDESKKGTIAFALSNVACNFDPKVVRDLQLKRWKKFYGFGNQTWLHEVLSAGPSSKEISLIVKIEYEPELDTKSETNTVYPQLVGYKYAKQISTTLMPMKINCNSKKIESILEYNFHQDRFTYLSPPFNDGVVEYKIIDNGGAFAILHKSLCGKK